MSIMLTGSLANTAIITVGNEETPDTTGDHQATATITIETEASSVLPDVDVSKTADQTTVTAGSVVGFTVTITNEGAATASGVTLNDPLPAGLGNDINWQIDTSTGNPSAFIITGAVGSQVLTLNPSSGIDLAAGASLTVHITGLTSTADVASIVTPTPPLCPVPSPAPP